MRGTPLIPDRQPSMVAIPFLLQISNGSLDVSLLSQFFCGAQCLPCQIMFSENNEVL
jgi:hypothetical protein